MGSVRRLVDWVVPWLERPDAAQLAKDEARLRRDVADIEAEGWSVHPEVAIDEARRIFDAEMARRTTADAKATTYLALIAALVPIGLTVQAAVVERKIGSAPAWVNLLILAVAMLYVVGAGVWAFRVLRVSGSARLDIRDMLRGWRTEDPHVHLVRTTLKAARLNWDGVNEKVTAILMTHAYLTRAFVFFTMLLVVNAGWTLTTTALDASRPRPARPQAGHLRSDHGTSIRPKPVPSRRATPQGRDAGSSRDSDLSTTP